MANIKKEEKVKEFEQTKEFTSSTGRKYVFQKVAPVEWLDILDYVESEKKGTRKRLYKNVFEHIVVQPSLKLEDFEDFGEMDEVATEAIRFQQNK
jgi:hypothetical protein